MPDVAQSAFGMVEFRAFREFLANVRSAQAFAELRAVEPNLQRNDESWTWIVGSSSVTFCSGHRDKTTPCCLDGNIDWDSVTRIMIMGVLHD